MSSNPNAKPFGLDELKEIVDEANAALAYVSRPQGVIEAEEKRQSHTPGPWTFGQSNNGRWGVWESQMSYNVLDASAPSINAEANARLIAAAPELLEACKTLVEHLAFFPEAVGMVGPGNVEIARNAIRKATNG